jgi:hypothetical protein
MIKAFEMLTPEEFDALVEAPALITALVGGADGHLDQEERYWSERLLRSRTYNKPRELNEFYRVVAEKFWMRLQGIMAELPTDTEARNQVIVRKLELLNPILAKLELHLAADLYHGFVGLAEETAKASGGFLRLGAISAEEAKWIHLPMIQPVIAPKKDRSEVDGQEADNWEND